MNDDKLDSPSAIKTFLACAGKLEYYDEAYVRLAKISVAHIYNLRKGTFYQRQRRHFTKTQYTAVTIGERRKPQSNGNPNCLRQYSLIVNAMRGIKR